MAARPVAAVAARSVAARSVAAAAAAAARPAAVAHPGDRAACAKSHDLTAGLTKDSAKLGRHEYNGTAADQNDLLRDGGGPCGLILSRRHLRIRYDVQSHLASHAWPRMSRKPSSSSDPGLAFYRAVPTHRLPS